MHRYSHHSRRYNVVSGLRNSADGHKLCGLATRCCDSCRASFECCDTFLEDVLSNSSEHPATIICAQTYDCWVADTRVDIAQGPASIV